jgi:hypothetical protein
MSSETGETVESLRKALETHRRNIQLFRGADAIRFQIEIDRIEKRLMELPRQE